MNDAPVTLKAEDAPVPPDPHEAGIALMEHLREITAGAEALRTLIANWYRDPARSQRLALDEAVETVKRAARAQQAGESMMRGRRAVGEFSFVYAEDGHGG